MRRHHRAAKRRWTTYYIQKLTTADSVAELKILDLGPHMIDKSRACWRNSETATGSCIERVSAAVPWERSNYRGVVWAVRSRCRPDGPRRRVVGRPGGIRGGGRPPAWRLKPGDPFPLCGIGARSPYVANLREFLSIAPMRVLPAEADALSRSRRDRDPRPDVRVPGKQRARASEPLSHHRPRRDPSSRR